jgi:putative pyoverdin transport system ATP-binding/permease protein
MNLIKFFLQHSRRLVILSLLAGVISGACNAMLLAVINGMLKANGSTANSLIVVFIGLCTLLPLSRFVSEILLNSLGQNALHILRIELIRQMLAAPLRHLEKLGPDRMLAALTDDVPVITASLLAIPLLCINATVVIGCLIYMGTMSALLLVIVLGFMVLGILTYQFPIIRASNVFRLAAAEGDTMVSHFRSVIQGSKELKMHSDRRQAFVNELVSPTAVSLKNHNLKAVKIYTAASSWGQTLVFVVIGLIIFALPRIQEISAVTLTGYVLSLLYLMSPLQVIMNMLPTLARANVAIRKVEELGFELAAKGTDGGLIAVASRKDWQELKFSSVVHSYQREGDTSDFVLGPVNLTFHPGQTVFIVGGNGSGKTTLIKLLTGLYAPEGGMISLDGDAIAADATDAYRQYFSVVFSDFFLFEHLLGLAAPELDDQARQYLSQLRLADKVRIENGKLSTIDLSQGQRKRLALLTAYLEDRPIYVFDEWAADQDPYFKKIFYMQLLQELKARGKTVFVISHDDRYYHLADRVIKLEDGQIVSDTLNADHQVLAEAIA